MRKKDSLRHDFSCFIEKLRSIEIIDSRTRIRFFIEDKLTKLVENLVLVILCPDNPKACKWTADIVFCIARISVEQNKGRWLRPATYYDYLWRESVYMDSPSRFDDDVKWRFKEENINLTQDMIEHARSEVQTFMEWISIQLSLGCISHREIVERLHVELTDGYHFEENLLIVDY